MVQLVASMLGGEILCQHFNEDFIRLGGVQYIINFIHVGSQRDRLESNMYIRFLPSTKEGETVMHVGFKMHAPLEHERAEGWEKVEVEVHM